MSDRIYYSREAEMRAQRQRMLAVLVFTALGLGIGTALAFMFTPEGRKVRRKASKALEQGIDTGRSKVSHALHDLEKEYPGVLRKFENLLGELR